VLAATPLRGAGAYDKLSKNRRKASTVQGEKRKLTPDHFSEMAPE